VSPHFSKNERRNSMANKSERVSMTNQTFEIGSRKDTIPIPSHTSIGVIGAGTMGSGIAQVAAVAGHHVKIFDTQTGAMARAIESIKAALRRGVARGTVSEQEALAAVNRVVPVMGLEELADSGLVIEAIAENLELKQDVFQDVEKIVAPDCILATNTSSLSITELATALDRPERFVGMHFFNPAPLMELTEIVSGLATDPQIIATVAATAKAWNKTPVHARSTPGFIVNRVARPFYVEALRLLSERAADPATIDELVRESGGFRMGPFELMDLVGNDINFAVTQSVFRASFFDPRFTPSLIQQEMVQAGFLGRKSGRGFYRYAPGVNQPLPAFEPPAPSPEKISFAEPRPVTEALLGRLQNAFPHASRSSRTDAAKLAQVNDAVLRLTDGRTASRVAHELGTPNVVLIDLAHDYGKARTLAISHSDQCSERAYRSIVGLLQTAGFNVVLLKDLPALVVMRIVTMVINEAADAVHYGVSNKCDVDLAMRKGLNYPAGPFGWAARLGTTTVYQVLENLATCYGQDRYRTSPLIERSFWSGRRLDEATD
jgi:3-hydroxybutyryl-CoA dehydrogenase